MLAVRLASLYGGYGYRRVTALLRAEGWEVNHKRVERIWRREGLKGLCQSKLTCCCGRVALSLRDAQSLPLLQ